MSNILSRWWNFTEGALVVSTVNDLMIHCWFHRQAGDYEGISEAAS